MDADVERFSVPLSRPLATSDRVLEERTGFLLRVSGGDSLDDSGVGEATPLPGWTESVEECRTALERACDSLASDGPAAALDGLADVPAARHGLALALADRRARAAGEPLYASLGATESTPSVPVNATIGDGDPDETAVAAERAVSEHGFECLKVKVGARSLDTDCDRLAAVRAAVGPEPELRADANGAWTESTARTALERFDGHDVAYVEQPLAADEVDACARLRDGPVGVALDESVAAVGIDAVLTADAADVVVLKPMVLGGPERTLAVARRAIDAGLTVVVSTTIDAVVARTAAVHVAAALAPIAPCGLATADRLARDLAPDPAPVQAGVVRVPQASGTSVDLDVLRSSDGS